MPDEIWNCGLADIYRQPDGTRGGWRGQYNARYDVVRVQMFNARGGVIRFDGSYAGAHRFVQDAGWIVP